MKEFWSGLAGVFKALIIGVVCIIIMFMVSTCTMFGALING